jgi:lysophospholipase L1-like esterase
MQTIRLITLLGMVALFAAVMEASADELNHGATNEQITGEEWWDIPYPQRFDTSLLTTQQEALSVSGKNITSENGTVVVLRGVNIADPGKLDYQGRWSRRIFEEVDNWGANVVRLPVHPVAWRKHGPAWYQERIDEAVFWANSLGLYLILDWHSIGNLNSQMYQHPMYQTTMAETRDFWRRMAFRYRDVPTVAVYEVFNEPTDNFIGNGAGSLGPLDWESWRETLEELVDIVQVYDPQSIVLVGGLNWAYSLKGVAEMPVRREGVAYASHAYPQKARPAENTRQAYYDAWHSDWGYVAETYPVIATEIGWVREDGYSPHVPVINNDGTYGPNLANYMHERGISWTVWNFDVDWGPRMISDWDFTPTEQGLFYRDVMQAAKAGELSPAVIPSPRVTEYPWMSIERWREMHGEDKAIAANGTARLLFLGDSITEMWPAALWEAHFASFGAANFGIGGDKTGHLLWRLQNGSTGKLAPETIVLMIGTNNFGLGDDSPEQVAQGIEAVVDQAHASWPAAQIVLLAILPRDEEAGTDMRRKVSETNALIATLGEREGVSYHDIGAAFLQEDGSISPELMGDFLHPTEKGYAVFAEQLNAILEPMLR